MKKLLLFLVPILLFACVDYTDDLIAIDDRLDKLEQTIPTIEEQITSIRTSIDALKAIDKELDDNIKALEESDKATAEEIAALKEVDKAIELRITELQKYVDDSLKSAKDWVIATFATLEQLYALSSEVAGLKNLVDANKIEAAANLATAISNLETSLKSWVGAQLSNYYTIAEVEAKITALQTAITEGDNALQEELNKLKTQLETAKSEITAAYKKAIEEAINTNNGVINNKIASEIATVNQRIDSEVATINAKIAELQAQVNQNTADIANLLARIQSVSYLPEYNDGKVLIERMASTSWGTLSFRISPKDAVAELEKVWASALSCEAYYPKTRAVSLVNLAITEFEGDTESGVITVKISGEGLSDEFFAGTQEAKVALVISDGNNQVVSDYANAYGHEITDEIWYTTTDGNVLTPNKEGVEVFGANIVSNTYENGKGVIKFDDMVTIIGEQAFGAKSNDGSSTTLQTITLPNSVGEIQGWAFAYCCDELTEITIPDSVTSIGKTAFGDLAKLESVTLGKNVESLGSHVFSKCVSLKSINLPEKITEIPGHCFNECASLEGIDIHDNIIAIGEYAFKNCDALPNIHLGNSIESIGKYAFESCQNWKGDLILPQSVKKLGAGAFHHCTRVTNVTLSDNLEEVGSGVFASCLSLNYFYGKFASADNRCFVFNGSLESVSRRVTGEYALPNGITYMNHYCITYPLSVTFVIPESVVDMHRSCILCPENIQGFKGKFATEDGLALIKDNHLYSFAPNGVTEYRIPTGITSVAYRLFLEIKTLQKLYVPSSVTTIPQKFIESCPQMKELYMESSTPPTIESGTYGIFFDMDTPTIYVPTGSVEIYKTADGWRDYADKIVGYNF